MKTVAEIIRLSSSFLREKGVDRSDRLAEEIIASVLGMNRLDLFMQFDRPLLESELNLIRGRVVRSAQGMPLEYMVGEVEFYGCSICVDKRVLIPRPETELLAELIAKRVERGILWDLCTGSGCLGISLKKAKPDLEVSLSDLSLDALEVARCNALKNKVQVDVYQGDLLGPFFGQKADYIVCNPPYICIEEYEGLDRSVRDYEPKIALVSGATGLEFYERLALELPSYLNPGAQVFLEIGYSQGSSVKRIFNTASWKKNELIKDWSGKDRFFFLEKQ